MKYILGIQMQKRAWNIHYSGQKSTTRKEYHLINQLISPFTVTKYSNWNNTKLVTEF